MCLLPVEAGNAPDGSAGVVVTWMTHNLLSLDWDRWNEHHGVQVAMNDALAQVLETLEFQVSAFGAGGAWVVTGRREQPGRETAR